jgi:hypothetical protein
MAEGKKGGRKSKNGFAGRMTGFLTVKSGHPDRIGFA